MEKSIAVRYSFVMTANFSVGNEWFKSIEYNGKSIRNGQTITAPLNSGITIKGTVIESDSVSDVGSGYVYLSLDGDEKTIEICVRENRGRYSGSQIPHTCLQQFHNIFVQHQKFLQNCICLFQHTHFRRFTSAKQDISEFMSH